MVEWNCISCNASWPSPLGPGRKVNFLYNHLNVGLNLLALVNWHFSKTNMILDLATNIGIQIYVRINADCFHKFMIYMFLVFGCSVIYLTIRGSVLTQGLCVGFLILVTPSTYYFH